MLAAIDGAISATDRPTACHTDSDRRSPPPAGSPAVVPSGRGGEAAIGRPPGGRGCACRRRGGGSVPLNCRFGEVCRPRFTTPLHHAGRPRTRTDGGGRMDLHERDERRAAAEAVVGGLAEAGVAGVVLPWVDTSGITRMKSVPLAKLPSAAQWGVGMSPVFDGFLVDDSIIAGSYAGSAIGDLRLHPDLAGLTVLAGQPGWAWAPVDRYTQDGTPHVQCSRSLLRRLVGELADEGLSVLAAFEIEWVLGVSDLPEGADPDAFVPAISGPAYVLPPRIEVSYDACELVEALGVQVVVVDQLHPEYL